MDTNDDRQSRDDRRYDRAERMAARALGRLRDRVEYEREALRLAERALARGLDAVRAEQPWNLPGLPVKYQNDLAEIGGWAGRVEHEPGSDID